jgi:hypothetical protein
MLCQVGLSAEEERKLRAMCEQMRRTLADDAPSSQDDAERGSDGESLQVPGIHGAMKHGCTGREPDGGTATRIRLPAPPAGMYRFPVLYVVAGLLLEPPRPRSGRCLSRRQALGLDSSR